MKKRIVTLENLQSIFYAIEGKDLGPSNMTKPNGHIYNAFRDAIEDGNVTLFYIVKYVKAIKTKKFTMENILDFVIEYF